MITQQHQKRTDQQTTQQTERQSPTTLPSPSIPQSTQSVFDAIFKQEAPIESIAILGYN